MFIFPWFDLKPLCCYLTDNLWSTFPVRFFVSFCQITEDSACSLQSNRKSCSDLDGNSHNTLTWTFRQSTGSMKAGSLNQRKWSRMTDADQFCLIAECLFCLWKCISGDKVGFIYPNSTLSRRRTVVWPRWELSLIVVVSYVTGPDSLSKNQFNSKIITAEEQKNFRSCNRKLSGGAWRGINGFLFVAAEWLAGSAQYKTTTTTTVRCSDLCWSFNSAAVCAAQTVFC